MACFQRFNSVKGLTIIEILVVLAILGLLAVSSLVALGTLRGGSDVQAEARALSRVLELAKSKTIASEGDARYGVYVDTGASPHQYVLFQTDTDYASRVVAEDEVYKLRDTIEFDPVSVSFGGGAEVVFDRIQGTTSQAGSAVLRVKADPSNTTTVYVEESGTVEIDNSAVPTDNDREKDTRHVHVTYSRGVSQINTATEVITLDFNPFPATTIAIASYLSGGQIVWEDTIIVGGEPQTLKIHTHKLNESAGGNFITQFSIHRDKRFNTKPFVMTISGDSTGKLIEYNATGQIITGGESIYVTATQEQ